MSLKSKIEAVIYASEEPVTLQQLIGLLGLEAQAALDAAADRQGELALLAPAEPFLLAEQEPGGQIAPNAETLDTELVGAIEPPSGTREALRAEEFLAEQEDEAAEQRTAPDAEGSGEGAASSAVAESNAASEPTPAQQRARERRLRDFLRQLLDELIADYRNGDHGLEVREVAGGFRFATKPEYHDAVRGFVRSLKPPLKLSLQALETLAVVAYRQPVTAPEVSEVRGVDSGGVLGSLMTRKLVTTAGRKQVIGRPILYKTTKDFLLRFGLKDLSELPSIEEFERMASGIAEAVQEEMPMERLDEMRPAGAVGDAPRNLEPMRAEHEAQADGIPDDADDEALTSPQDGPGEFAGNETVPPADNVLVDGRETGVPPNYDSDADAGADSPLQDAEIQSDTQREGAGS